MLRVRLLHSMCGRYAAVSASTTQGSPGWLVSTSGVPAPSKPARALAPCAIVAAAVMAERTAAEERKREAIYTVRCNERAMAAKKVNKMQDYIEAANAELTIVKERNRQLMDDLLASNARLVCNVKEGERRARDYELASDGCKAKRAHEAQQLLEKTAGGRMWHWSRSTKTGRRV